MISGVSRGGKLYARAHEDNIDSDGAIDFLKHLHRHTRRRLVVLWDHGSIHTSRKTKTFLQENRRWVEAYFLPGYAPDLNPAELFNGQLKYHELKNCTPHDLEELKQLVRLAVMRIRARRGLVRSFFRGCVLYRGR